MKNFSLTITFFIGLVTISSCFSKNDQFDPLNFGITRWEYEVARNFHDDPTRNESGEATVSIQGIRTINGAKYLEFSNQFSGLSGTKPSIVFRRKKNDGVYFLTKDGAFEEHKELPLPLTVGKKWAITDSKGEIEYVVEKVVSITIGKDVYKDCLKIKFEGFTTKSGQRIELSGHRYFAPLIGTVKEITRVSAPNVNVTVTQTLLSFSKGEAPKTAILKNSKENTSERVPATDIFTKNIDSASNIRKVDFKNFTYKYSDKSIKLVNGKATKKDQGGTYFNTEFGKVVYGDLSFDSDGTDEAAVMILSEWTGAANPANSGHHRIFFFTMWKGKVTQYHSVDFGDIWGDYTKYEDENDECDGWVWGIDIDNIRNLKVTYTLAVGGRHCIEKGYDVKMTYAWKNSGFALVEAPTKRKVTRR